MSSRSLPSQFVFVLIPAVLLTGCFGGGSSSDSGSTEPDEIDQLGEGAGFDGFRFFYEQDAGLKAVGSDGHTPAHKVDEEANSPAMFPSLAGTVDDGEVTDARPDGIFYTTEDHLYFVASEDDDGSVPDREQLSNQDVDEGLCIEYTIFDLEDTDNTALAYHVLDDEDEDCPMREDQIGEGLDWKQVQRGDDDGTDPAEFPEDVRPVVPLTDSDGDGLWLVIDEADDELRSLPVSDLSEGALETINGGSNVTDVEAIEYLDDGNIVVAIDETGNGNYAVGFLNVSDESLEIFGNSDLGGRPIDGQSAASGNTAFVVVDNVLVRITADDQDGIDGHSGTDTQFVVTSDAHVVWDDGDGAVRAVAQDAELDPDAPQGTEIASAPMAETTIFGSAGDWVFFTLADGLNADGTPDNPRAKAYHAANDSLHTIADGQWVGASLSATATDTGGQVDANKLSEVFVVYGDGGLTLGALDANDPNGGAVVLGELPSEYPLALVNTGFGPQRLLTASESFSAGSDPDNLGVDSQVLFFDINEPGSLKVVTEEPGMLNLAAPFY